MSQDAVKNLTGLGGGMFVSQNTGRHSGEWNAVQFTQDSQISHYEGNIDQSQQTMQNVGFPGGFVLFGVTTEIELSVGSAILYNK